MFKKSEIIQLGLNGVTLAEGKEEDFLTAIKEMNPEEFYLMGSSQLARILLQNEPIWGELHRLKYLGLQNCSLTTLGRLKVNGTMELQIVATYS